MKGRKRILILSLILAVCFAGSMAVCAHADGTAVPETQSVKSEDIRRTIKRTFSFGGYAFHSSRPELSTISAMGIGGFSGNYGAQLRTGSLERAIYDKMVEYYVKSRKTGSINIPCKYSFSGVGKYEESDEYKEAEEDLDFSAESAYTAFVYDYPEIFWVYEMVCLEDLSVKVTYTEANKETGTFTGGFTGVTISFSEIYSGARESQGAFSAAVSNAKRAIEERRTDATQYQTLKAIHDYVCELIIYPSDYDLNDSSTAVPQYHSAAGVFLKGGVAVCEGYAKSFMILCHEFDIPAILVVGDAGESHMWNYVQLQGSWYAVDTTWDDVPGGSTTYFLIGSGTSVPGGTFGTTRILNTCFSESGNSRNFNYPVLSGSAYRNGNVHVHSWVVISSTDPTCTENGKIINECTSCGETSCSVVAALGHSFHDKKYIYNNDATVLQDGTKTLVCDNGCGTTRGTVIAEGTKLEPTIELNASSLRLKIGQSTKALKVSGLAKGDSVKSWKSTNTKIVKVSSSGKITAQKRAGTAKIKIKLASGLQRTVKVTVQVNDVTTSAISGVARTLTLTKGKTRKLTPALSPITSVQRVSYRSSNTQVATVSASGKIKARKKGKTTITVKSGNKTVKCKVVVK